MAELKHIGRIRNTGKKCIVAYRTLPGESNACLIVPTENLPDSYHDSIINLVESTAGQDAYEFAEAMARTNFSDGSIMLAALHTQGRMIKMPTREIEMLPTPAVAIVLSELNQIIAEQRGLAVDDLALDDGIKRTNTPVTPVTQSDPGKTTSQSINEPEVSVPVSETVPVSFKSADDEAKYYRSQADKMSKQAAELRRKAEELVPTKKAK
jgi:hypothetical protein